MEQHERLRQYNRWRRGEEDWAPDERGPDPKELGELIDGVADRLEVLEREHQEFFERWHEERRKREALERAMTEIAAHHEEQRDCWANEWNADADQARYHEERRNLALWHLTPNNRIDGACKDALPDHP